MTDAPNVPTPLSPAAYVIRELGGLTSAANKLRKPVTTVQGWQIRGRIPQKYWPAAMDAAAADNIEIRLVDFLNNHPAAETRAAKAAEQPTPKIPVQA